MTRKEVLVGVSVALAFTSNAFAVETDKNYFTIDSVKVEDVTPVTDQASGAGIPDGYAYVGNPLNNVLGDLDLTGLALDKIVNIGKTLWGIVEANKPVVNIKTDTASALPQGLKDWQSLAGWQMPFSKAYRITYTNLYGMNVVDFTYRLIFTYGGSANGRGKYLANVTVVPADVNVSWGFTFNAQATVPTVQNAGTSKNPMGAAQVNIKWSVDSILKHLETTNSYYVRGDGFFKDLNASAQ